MSKWFGRALLVTYPAGYVLHIALAAIHTWSTMTFFQWWTYMASQVGWYAPTWPLWVVLYALHLI